jgi:hypothetical protein
MSFGSETRTNPLRRDLVIVVISGCGEPAGAAEAAGRLRDILAGLER